ncbi:hypothetical protein AKJ50_01275 [candidate division MSBL1 archaeon SCGC-AAA382A13]|uniref:ABC-2 type transport system permease protein n=1 Tax=candidate division MSBL1 archaeon SCGC-AAA382A13 TaxID=1698279 RepID=A0A133VFV9_9EURY|nr:hypothetical protein AKJ50_01275 [candidate division MSBL1 archaeon SCGC-AAA382A13]
MKRPCDKMDLGTTFRTAVILAKEKIYQGQKEKTGAAKKETATNRKLWIANLSMIPFFAMLSFFLAGAQVATGMQIGAFSLLLLVQLFISIFITLNSVSTFQDLGMHKPLLPLPISREYLVVSLSWLLSGGAAILIIPLLAAIIYAWTTGTYLAIPMSFLWGVLTMLLGHSLGLAVTNLFSFEASERSTLGTAFRFLKIGGALLLFLLWFFIFTQEGFLSPLLEPLTAISKSLWFLYPFNASRSIVSFSSVYMLSLLLYGSLFSGIYWLAGSRTWENITAPSFAVSETVGELRMEIGGKFKSLIKKDLTLSFRSGQKFLGILAFPLMILFMNLIDVIRGGTVSLFQAEIIYLMTAILSGFGIIYLYIQEGESAWIMSTLPISKKDFALQKALSAFSLFPLYAAPAILLVSVKMRYGIPVVLMQFVSGFAMALTSCLVVSNSLADRLPENLTVITQETFGSRYTPLLLVLKSGILSGWPVLASIGLYLVVTRPLSALAGSIILLTLTTTLVALNLIFTLWRYDLLGVSSSNTIER